MQRRQFVRVAGVACVAGLAGCGGDGASDPEATPGDSTPTSSGEGGQGGQTDAPPADSGDDNGDGGDGEGESGSDTAAFGEAVAFEDSYAMDIEYSDPETGESGTVSARFADGNSYMELEGDGEQVEIYNVDGSTYMVTQGQCSRFPGSEGGNQFSPPVNPRSGIDAADEAAQANPNVQAAGTTTIDGETVYVYEFDGSEQDAESATYYVSASTGYLRRVESETAQMDIHSWGEVDPISAPDMDCQDFSGA